MDSLFCVCSGSSELFATCGFEDIRIWHVGSLKELLRITVPNMTCLTLEFSRGCRTVLSGWNDSRVRSHFLMRTAKPTDFLLSSKLSNFFLIPFIKLYYKLYIHKL